jgi:ferritin-like metal-binding protein YciE
MKLKTLNDLFVDCVKDLYSAENQLLKALPKLAKKATTPELKQSFERHLAETEVQKERLDQISELLEISPKGKKCAAMEGLITEAEELIAEVKEPDVLDAALIGAAQKVEHYEIASYGTAATYAKLLNNPEVLKLLAATLEEEKKTDALLTELAEGIVNEKAAQVEK